MKKLLFALLVLFACQSAFGQIQRKFFGIELGVSDRAYTKKAVKMKGFSIKEEQMPDENGGGGGMSIPNVVFANLKWDSMEIVFGKDGKVKSVYFYCLDTGDEFSDLMQILKTKYYLYLDENTSFMKYAVFAHDDYTQLSCIGEVGESMLLRYSIYEGIKKDDL